MNLTDVERLVRRIGELMDGRVPEEQARPIAQEYATLSENASHRLRQCATMLDQGDEAQALQLADSPPPLLDLVTRLGFRRLAEWRDYCQKLNIPSAENLDAKFIRQLSDAYGQGIAPDHLLYRRLREAVQSRDDLRILDALRSIRRRNPADTGVSQQLERLERKVLGLELEKLADALAAGDDARVVGLIGDIEAGGFDRRPEGPAWSAAQIVRCRILLGQATRLHSRKDWASAGSILSLIHGHVRDENLALGPDESRTLGELDAWFEQCRRHAAEDRDFTRTLIELRTLVDACEQSNEGAQRVDRPVLRERLQSLESGWRKLENFRRDVDADLTRRWRKAKDLVGEQLDARNRFVRRWTVVGLVVLVGFALLSARSFWNRRGAVEWAAQLKSQREARQVGATERTLPQASTHLLRFAGASPALRSEVDASEQFVAAEHARQQKCETLLQDLARLAEAGFAGPSPEQVQARFNEAEKSAAEVAEDLRPPLVANLAASRAKWEEWLLGQRRIRETEFDRQFADVNQTASALGYERGPAGVAEVLARVSPGLRALTTLATPPVSGLRLPPDALTQLSTLSNRVAAFSDQVARWQVISNAWKQPRTLEAYLAALQELQRSEFAATTDRTRAGAVLALNLTPSSLPAGLLLPGDPEAWRRFEAHPALTRMPAQILPGERKRLNDLRDGNDGANLFSILLHQLTRVPSTPSEPATSWTVFARGPLTRNKFGRKVGQVYDPVFSPNLVEFHPREFHSAEYTIVETGPAEEGTLAERVGLKKLLESGTSTNFASPLLGVLDAINRADLGSPLCRAFLALKLHELMDLRPLDWDVHWAPQAVQDRNRLRELGAAGIASGDWLDTRRTTALAQALSDHFARARRVSYTQQAAFLVALARSATQAGFRLVGNADAAGNPHLPLPLPDGTEVWGWAEDSHAPALLHRIQNTNHSTPVLTLRRSVPLAPLFVFVGNRARLLEETRQAASNDPASLGPFLPPLFAAPTP